MVKTRQQKKKFGGENSVYMFNFKKYKYINKCRPKGWFFFLLLKFMFDFHVTKTTHLCQHLNSYSNSQTKTSFWRLVNLIWKYYKESLTKTKKLRGKISVCKLNF